MTNLRATASGALRAGMLAAALLGLCAAGGAQPALADDPLPYTVEVSDITAKVGAPAVLHATVRLRDGYRLLEAYNNRVMQLSSWDGGVAFEHKVVDASARDGALDFAIGLSPTKPGKHPINGVFRFGYIGGDTMMMISVPLIANVTGTE